MGLPQPLRQSRGALIRALIGVWYPFGPLEIVLNVFHRMQRQPVDVTGERGGAQCPPPHHKIEFNINPPIFQTI